MKKLVSRLTMVTLLCAFGLNAGADTLTFFGEDLGKGEAIRLPSHPNADVARTAFLSNLVGVGTETFESFANGAVAPKVLDFGATGTATLIGSGNVNNVPSGTNGSGRYPISGDQYWESGQFFEIEFSAPVAAFGFYGIDIGDYGGQVTLTLTLEGGGSKLLNIENTVNGSGGGVLYYGVVETNVEDVFTSVTFGNTAPGTDFFGFDDMTIGSIEQVQQPPVIPVPAAVWMAIPVLGGLFALRRRQRIS